MEPRTRIEEELTRRGFVVGAGGAALGLSALATALRWLADPPPAAAQLGLAPDDPAVRATMEALADTVVPGPAGGAHSAPGAIEAGVVEELYDPFYGAAPSYPVIHQDLLLSTQYVLGRAATFNLSLPYPDREKVLANRMVAPGSGGQNPNWVLFQGAAILVYIAYHGTARSELGPRWLQFPPRSTGYWPRHSYRLRFRRMTRSGNPR